MSLPTNVPEDKLRETQHLLDLYDTAIDRQEQTLDKCKRGKFKSAQVSDDVLFALVRGDLKLLQKDRENIIKKKESLEKLISKKKDGISSMQDILDSSDSDL